MRRISWPLLIAATLVTAVAACDVGGVFVVDNKSDVELVVRVSGREQDPGASGVAYRDRRDVLSVPPHARLVVEELSFTSTLRIEKVEVLDAACTLLRRFDVEDGVAFERDGYLIAVESNLSARLVDEFPRDGTPASPSDRCTGT